MKIKYISAISAIVATAVMTTSCIDDSSSYGGGELASLSISVPGDAEMPIYSYNYGDECELTPTVNYDGDGELTYEWSIGTFDNGVKGTLEVVSNEKVLRHFFEEGGSYYAHLVVTDGEVGTVQDYQIDINRTFEQGYLLISNGKNGEGNLAFIKDQTREEIEAGEQTVIMENCLQRINPEIGKEPLVGVKIIKWFVTSSKTITRVLVGTEKQGLYLDPNTFVVSSAINYNDIISGFKSTKLLADYTNPIAYDPAAKKFILMDSQYMFGYESSTWKSINVDDIISYTYTSGLNQYTDNYFVTYEPFNVYGMVLDMNTWAYTLAGVSELGENGPLFYGEEPVAIFQGEGIKGQYSTTYPCDIITRNKTTGKMYTTSVTGFGSYSFGLTISGREEMKTDASTALPAKDSKIAASSFVHRTYYYNDNCVYAMLQEGTAFVLPSTSQSALSFPENEEVTFVGINTDPDNNSTTEGEDLLVATADKTTGRANVYIYDIKDVRTDNPNATPKVEYRDCADRIIEMLYKPRIAN